MDISFGSSGTESVSCFEMSAAERESSMIPNGELFMTLFFVVASAMPVGSVLTWLMHRKRANEYKEHGEEVAATVIARAHWTTTSHDSNNGGSTTHHHYKLTVRFQANSQQVVTKDLNCSREVHDNNFEGSTVPVLHLGGLKGDPRHCALKSNATQSKIGFLLIGLGFSLAFNYMLLGPFSDSGFYCFAPFWSYPLGICAGVLAAYRAYKRLRHSPLGS